MRTCPRVVALTGAAGSGKTAAAYALQHALGAAGCLAIVVGFADPIKHGVGAMVGRDGFDGTFKTDHVGPGGLTGRRLLQLVGDAVRTADPQFWIDRAASVVSSAGRTTVILHDLRFPLEAHYVHGVGGVVVRVLRAGNLHGDEAVHASEVPLHPSHIDAVLDNRGPLSALPDAWRAVFGTEPCL